MGFKLIMVFAGAFCSSCVSNANIGTFHGSEYFRYSNFDRSRVSTFSYAGARLESSYLLSDAGPISPIYFVKPEAGVDCISIGPKGTSVEFAIKRQIKSGDIYKCNNSIFKVERCFDNCQTASVLISNNNNNAMAINSPQYSRIIFNQCVGVVAIDFNIDSDNEDIRNRVYLMNDKGILASNDFPNCIVN